MIGGDLIDHRPVLVPNDVTAYLREAGKRVGDTVTLWIWREGSLLTVEVRLRPGDGLYAIYPGAI